MDHKVDLSIVHEDYNQIRGICIVLNFVQLVSQNK